jgi:hypothetical protein
MCAATTATLAMRFALAVAGLRDMLVAHIMRADHTQPDLAFAWQHLTRLTNRIATLAQRLAAGRSVTARSGTARSVTGRSGTARSSTARKRATPPAARGTTQTRQRLPNTIGWLLEQDIRFLTYTEYFRHLFDQPETAALLEAEPQLKRQLRPILRLLMADLPEALALPPRSPRPKRVRPSRSRLLRQNPCHGARRPKEFWRPGPIRPHWTA